MSEETETEHEETTTTELPPEQETRIVDKVIAAVKGIIAAPGEVVEETGTDKEVDDKPAKEPTSVKEIENDMEAQVRAALKKIGAEEEHAKEHEKLKEAETERPPVQVGRVTRAIWGAE